MTPPKIVMPASDLVWAEVIDLFASSDDIILVGGLMVATFAAQHGLEMPRVTTDIDTLVRVEALADQPREFVAALRDRGYELLERDTKSDGHGFRYTRQAGKQRFTVDVLVDRSKTHRRQLTTEGTLRPAEIPGGAYALNMPETIHITCGKTSGPIVRPSLLGALLLKSRAAIRDKTRQRDRHLTDLAVLYASVEDPAALRQQTSAKHRTELRRPQPALEQLDPANRSPAKAARDYLTRSENS